MVRIGLTTFCGGWSAEQYFEWKLLLRRKIQHSLIFHFFRSRHKSWTTTNCFSTVLLPEDGWISYLRKASHKCWEDIRIIATLLPGIQLSTVYLKLIQARHGCNIHPKMCAPIKLLQNDGADLICRYEDLQNIKIGIDVLKLEIYIKLFSPKLEWMK